MRKRSVVKVAAASCALVLGLMVGTPAFAAPAAYDGDIATYANNVDHGFAFHLRSGATGGTVFRHKEDYSSLYISILSHRGNSLSLYVDGAYNTKGKGTLNCTQGKYRSNHKGQWEMYNLVRENGRAYARLTAWADRGPGAVNGVWSPDCVGHYPVLPA